MKRDSTKTTLGHAAGASYISRKLCIWSLVACQSYRNLGLCWSESNQRVLSLSERAYAPVCSSKDCNKYGWACPHEWDQSYWNSNNSGCFSSSSTSLEHSSTPRCTLHKLALDCIPSFNPSSSSVGSFYQSPLPKKDASVVRKYSYVPDSTALDVVLNTRGTP